jgi:formylglycine-generating enzyme required for sulfatase activity
VNVSWLDAQAFCQRLALRTGKNYTLPSEAQWEYACRAGTTTPFHYGATISTELVNYDGGVFGSRDYGDYRQETTDAASFPANPWGLHDMHGNVWEWCKNHRNNNHNNHEDALKNDKDWVGSDTVWNLTMNRSDTDYRLLRGGSWRNDLWICQSAFYTDALPGYRDNEIGFRVCCLPQD